MVVLGGGAVSYERGTPVGPVDYPRPDYSRNLFEVRRVGPGSKVEGCSSAHTAWRCPNSVFRVHGPELKTQGLQFTVCRGTSLMKNRPTP